MTIDSKFINEFVSSQDNLSQARLCRVRSGDVRSDEARSGDQEFFQLTAEEWLGHQDIPTEKVTYASLSPTAIIKEIEYEGVNRYLEGNPNAESFKIILHLRNFESLAKLARLLEYSRFKKVCLLDTIRSLSEESLLSLHFSQAGLEKNTDYLDDLFTIIGQIETLPLALLTDLKSVIAYNCVERFKRCLAIDGFDAAFKLLRQTSLKRIFSPFYVAALHCRRLQQFKEARRLIQSIPKDHANYEIGRSLERAIYEQEIKTLKEQIDHLKPAALRLKETLENKENTLKNTNTPPTITYPDVLKNNIEILTNNKSLPLQIHSSSFSKPITFSHPHALKQKMTEQTPPHRENIKLTNK